MSTIRLYILDIGKVAGGLFLFGLIPFLILALVWLPIALGVSWLLQRL